MGTCVESTGETGILKETIELEVKTPCVVLCVYVEMGVFTRIYIMSGMCGTE